MSLAKQKPQKPRCGAPGKTAWDGSAPVLLSQSGATVRST